MDNSTATCRDNPLQREAKGQIRADSAQQTAKVPATEEGASDRPSWADLPDMLREEKKHVVELRDSELRREVADKDLFGLALSGGGIRSATFSLGVLQALAQRGWIRKIDYLSTVSGGGYVGSWLSACIYHAHKTGENDAVAVIEKRIAPTGIRADDVEPTKIRFLRAYSSYLTPRLGLLSGDTLALLTGFLRNLSLNLFLGIVSIFLVIAAIHWLIAIGILLIPKFQEQATLWFDYKVMYIGSIALTLFFFALGYIATSLTLQSYDVRVIKYKKQYTIVG